MQSLKSPEWLHFPDTCTNNNPPGAYFDTFLVFTALSVPLVALVFTMKRSVAQRIRTPARVTG